MPAEGDWGPPDSAHMAEDHDLENSQGRRGVPYGQRDYPSPSLVEVRQELECRQTILERAYLACHLGQERCRAGTGTVQGLGSVWPRLHLP